MLENVLVDHVSDWLESGGDDGVVKAVTWCSVWDRTGEDAGWPVFSNFSVCRKMWVGVWCTPYINIPPSSSEAFMCLQNAACSWITEDVCMVQENPTSGASSGVAFKSNRHTTTSWRSFSLCFNEGFVWLFRVITRSRGQSEEHDQEVGFK